MIISNKRVQNRTVGTRENHCLTPIVTASTVGTGNHVSIAVTVHVTRTINGTPQTLAVVCAGKRVEFRAIRTRENPYTPVAGAWLGDDHIAETVTVYVAGVARIMADVKGAKVGGVIAYVTDAIVIRVSLIGIKVVGTVIAHVAHPVDVPIGLIGIIIVRAVVTDIAHAVFVRVKLVGVVGISTVVDRIGHTIAVAIEITVICTDRVDHDLVYLNQLFYKRGA